MEAKGAEHPLAQFVESSEPTQHPPSFAAVSATVEPFVHPSLPDTTPSLVDSSVDIGGVNQEEVEFSDPTEPVVVETVDLLGLGGSASLPSEAVTPPQPPQQPTPIISGQGAAPAIAPTSIVDPGAVAGAAVSAPDPSAEPVQVVEGGGPSAPSRPPRTRGARGGTDTQYKKYPRAY